MRYLILALAALLASCQRVPVLIDSAKDLQCAWDPIPRTPPAMRATFTGASPADKANNFGPNKALIVLANFSDIQDTFLTKTTAQAYFDGTAAAFFAEASYGKASLQSEVRGWYSLPMTAATGASYIATSPEGLIVPTVSALFAADPALDLSKYRHLVIFAPWAVNGFGGTAWNNVTVATPAGPLMMQVALVQDPNGANPFDLVNSSILHEISHLFGAWHDNSIGCPAGGPAITPNDGTGCGKARVGNSYSVTGLHASDHPGHMGPENKAEHIGWLAGSNLLDLTGSAASTAVMLEPYETVSTGVKAVTWYRGIESGYGPDRFYIEYRTATGFDAGFSYIPGTYVGVIVSNKSQSGLFLTEPELIDMSPSFVSTDPYSHYPNSTNPVTLGVGKTFVDQVTGFTVSVNSISSSGAVVTVTPGGVQATSPPLPPTPIPAPPQSGCPQGKKPVGKSGKCK